MREPYTASVTAQAPQSLIALRAPRGVSRTRFSGHPRRASTDRPPLDSAAVRVVAFFNHKGGVGETTLLFNVALALHDLGRSVIIFDADAEANVTGLAMTEEAYDRALADNTTIWSTVAPLVTGAGDIAVKAPVAIRRGVRVVPGDIRLSNFEAILPVGWTEALSTQDNWRFCTKCHRLFRWVRQRPRLCGWGTAQPARVRQSDARGEQLGFRAAGRLEAAGVGSWGRRRKRKRRRIRREGSAEKWRAPTRRIDQGEGLAPLLTNCRHRVRRVPGNTGTSTPSHRHS